VARTKAHRVSVPVRPRRAHWQALLEEWRQSGLSQAEFCRRRGILPGTLAFWKHTLAAREAEAGRARGRRARPALPTFLPVRVVAPAPAMDNDHVDAAAVVGELAIMLRGRRHVRVRGRVDLHWLGQVLRTLEGLGC
jgi:hypothetical protein